MSLVTLGVGDVEQATGSYEAVGWRRSSLSVDDTIRFLSGGTVVLGCSAHADLAADAAVNFAADGYAPVALAMNPESRAGGRRCAGDGRAGGRITKRAAETEWGGYSGYVADLDGHLWEIAHDPFVPLADSGQMLLPDD